MLDLTSEDAPATHTKDINKVVNIFLVTGLVRAYTSFYTELWEEDF